MQQDQLSNAMGCKVTLGHLSFPLRSSSLDAHNITIADDPAFSASRAASQIQQRHPTHHYRNSQ